MNAAPELLKAAVQGDEQACEQMLRENSGLIWSIVRAITAAAWSRTTSISLDALDSSKQ